MSKLWRGLLLAAGVWLLSDVFAASAAGAAQNDEEPRWNNEYCLGCHGTEGLEVALPSGETFDVTIDRAGYEQSVHGQFEMACALCHTDIIEYPHRPLAVETARQYTVQHYTACATCHDSEYTATHDNVHAAALTGGNVEAAVCTDCHGAHEVTEPGKRATAIQQTCEQCHFEIYTLYAESVHGAALFEEDNEDVPTCTDCHGVHNVEGPTDSRFHLFSPQICASCHEDEELMGKYGISTEVFDTYVADFHGTTIVIFEELFPDQETNKAGLHRLPRGTQHRLGRQPRQPGLSGEPAGNLPAMPPGRHHQLPGLLAQALPADHQRGVGRLLRQPLLPDHHPAGDRRHGAVGGPHRATQGGGAKAGGHRWLIGGPANRRRSSASRSPIGWSTGSR